jgi:hypothetical protein
MRRPWVCLALVAAVGVLPSCQKAYYGAMETLGKHKRDLLVERVTEARDSQEQAKEQFKTALEAFSDVMGFSGGDLKTKYEKLKSQLDASEAKASAVNDRVASVEKVAKALFDEWESELGQYADDDLRLSSEVRLRETQMRYAQLLRAMRRAQQKMDPVLAAFRDRVLYLKHNLNAEAVASLQRTAVELDADVARLIAEMEASIREAGRFIDAMGKP